MKVKQEDISEFLSSRKNDVEVKLCLEQVREGYVGKLQYTVPLRTYCWSKEECPLQEKIEGQYMKRCSSSDLNPFSPEKYWRGKQDDVQYDGTNAEDFLKYEVKK